MPHCVQAQRVRQRPLLALEHALDRALVTTLEHQVDRLVGTRVLPIRLNGKHAAVVPHLGRTPCRRENAWPDIVSQTGSSCSGWTMRKGVSCQFEPTLQP